MAEIVAEPRIKLAVAQQLLRGWAQAARLDRAVAERAIVRGFRHVEEKLLATEEN